MAHRPSPPSRRKGLSLSLSKKNPLLTQSVQPLPQNQNWHICIRPSLQPPARVLSNKVFVNVQPLPRPPVIIYRYQKSEWEKLQQTNQLKRQEVQRMKVQLQNLTNQVDRKKQAFVSQSLPCSPSAKKVDEKRNNLSAIDQVATFNPSEPSLKQIIPEKVKQAEMSEQQTFYKINIIEPIAQTKRQEQNSISTQKQNQSQQEKKKGFRSKRNPIDINSLLEIQNRLNQLIDFTTV